MKPEDKLSNNMVDTQNGDLSIYLHWPFCQAKCPYCDFNSHVRHKSIDEEGFFSAYLREIDFWRERVDHQQVSTIFFGGGTPSLMSEKLVGNLLQALNSRFRFVEDIEITLEANPSSVEAKRFSGYRSAGVNRVSLGLQSLNDEALKTLGRLHNVKQGLDALDLAKAHFDSVSFDLIYARFHQERRNWMEELSAALAFEPDHMSLYQLTIEEETPFASLIRSGKQIPLEDEIALEMYLDTNEKCRAEGLKPYEVSNYAKPGHEARHNLVYWRYGDYLGIGPGAHGRITIEGHKTATSTIKIPELWRDSALSKGHGLISEEILSKQEQAREYILMGMRLTEGIDCNHFEKLNGSAFDPDKLDLLEDLGLIKCFKDNHAKIGHNSKTSSPNRIAATEKGRCVLNSLISELLD